MLGTRRLSFTRPKGLSFTRRRSSSEERYPSADEVNGLPASVDSFLAKRRASLNAEQAPTSSAPKTANLASKMANLAPEMATWPLKMIDLALWLPRFECPGAPGRLAWPHLAARCAPE